MSRPALPDDNVTGPYPGVAALADLPILRHRGLIRQLVGRELRNRYQGSNLGLLWTLVTPGAMLAIYSFVFSTILPTRWQSPSGDPSGAGEFALTLFAGLVPFTLFVEVLNSSPSVVTRVPNYVKKVVFPLEILPVVVVGTAAVQSLLWVVVLVAGWTLLGHDLSPSILLLPLAYVPLLLLCLGVAWFLAALGVYVRDVAQGTVLVGQAALFLTPIFYPPAAVPAAFRQVQLVLNPLATIVASFRSCLLWGQPLPWGSWAAWTLVAAVAALAGHAWFQKARVGFVDVL